MTEQEKQKPSLLMAVYNGLHFDGRVTRSAEALSDTFDITILSLFDDKPYTHKSFKVIEVEAPQKLTGVLKIFYFWFKFIQTAFKQKPHAIYAHDYYMPMPAALAAVLFKAKYIYDSHELLTPEAGKKKSKRDTFFYLLEKWSIKRANEIIAANVERAEIMQQHYDLSTQPTVIRNILPHIQEDDHKDVELSDKVKHLMEVPKNKTRIVYQGVVDKKRGIFTFVDAMDHLDDKFELIFIGTGPNYKELKERENDKISVLGRVSRDELHKLLTACHIGVVTYPTAGLNNIYCAPNKIYEYAQTGLAMVATCQPPLKRIFSEHNIGQVVGCNSTPSSDAAKEAAQAIRDIARNLPQHQQALRKFTQQYSWEHEAETLQKALRRLAY